MKAVIAAILVTLSASSAFAETLYIPATAFVRNTGFQPSLSGIVWFTGPSSTYPAQITAATPAGGDIARHTVVIAVPLHTTDGGVSATVYGSIGPSAPGGVGWPEQQCFLTATDTTGSAVASTRATRIHPSSGQPAVNYALTVSLSGSTLNARPFVHLVCKLDPTITIYGAAIDFDWSWF